VRITKKVEDSLTEQHYLICPAHINSYGRLFGGQLLKWIDELAGIVAIRHCGTLVTTASIDNLQFKAPAYSGDLIMLRGFITGVGKTSVEVRVDTFLELPENRHIMINQAYINLVSIDKSGTPLEVPLLAIETEEQKKELSASLLRREIRNKLRSEQNLS